MKLLNLRAYVFFVTFLSCPLSLRPSVSDRFMSPGTFNSSIPIRVKIAIASPASSFWVLAAIVATSVVLKARKLRAIENDLYTDRRSRGKDGKVPVRTWNVLDEVFPTVFTMTQAGNEARNKVLESVSSFDDAYAYDASYLITFVKNIDLDSKRLTRYLQSLERETMIGRAWKMLLHNSIFIMFKKRIAELAGEVKRYQKRLSYIRRIVITSNMYKKQLKNT